MYSEYGPAGLSPDEGTYTIMIRVCEMAGKMERGYALLQVQNLSCLQLCK